jgi:Lsr2
MARNVSVVVTDDIDGSSGAETVTFGFDGTTYEIDLSKSNRAKLDAAVAPYLEAGRRIRTSGRRSSPSASPSRNVDSTAVRAWARERGLLVSERGRISAEILRQYEQAS